MQRNAPDDASAMDGLKVLLRAFAGVPGNWFVLARNFVPVEKQESEHRMPCN